MLTQVILPGIKRVNISITKATVNNNFYIVKRDDGTESDAAEDIFSDIENAATSAIRSLVEPGIQAGPIPAEARTHVAQWIATQYLRVPSVRRLSTEIDKAMKGDGLPIATKTGEIIPRFEPKSPPDFVRIQLDLIWRNIDRVAEALYYRPWILSFFYRKTLATCDTPVFLNGPPNRYGMKGIMDAQQIHVPLDRRACLSIMEPGGNDRRAAGTVQRARQFNEMMVSNARQFLYHHPDDDPLAGLDLPQPREREMLSTEAANELIRESLIEVLQMPEVRDHPDNPLAGRQSGNGSR